MATTPTPLPELLAAVSALPDRDQITFGVKGEKIIGRWEAESYRVTATLDSEFSVYDLEEKKRGDKGGRVRKQLETFLDEHGWSPRPDEVHTVGNRLIIR